MLLLCNCESTVGIKYLRSLGDQPCLDEYMNKIYEASGSLAMCHDAGQRTEEQRPTSMWSEEETAPPRTMYTGM